MGRIPNPVKLLVLQIGLVLSRLELIDEERARRTTDLAWPRIITGLARMSKNAVDIAMVGVAVGSAAIVGVGFAMPFWSLGRSMGGGVAGGAIALVSQCYGAEEFERLGQTVRSSVLLVVASTLPFTIVFWIVPAELISLITNDPEAIAQGSTYLRIVGLGVPFTALNLIGSRVFVGIDDAWTPMVVRAGGAVTNIVINAILIFGLDLGILGAAIGTVVANVAMTFVFAFGLITGGIPGVGTFPVRIDPWGSYFEHEIVVNLVTIALPVLAKQIFSRLASFPMLAIVDMFGQDTVAAYVVARRVWSLMNTPGWGFGLAASSLVGQELGTGDEDAAGRYGREILLFSFTVYLVAAAFVFVFAEPITLLFFNDSADPAVPIAVALVYAACVAIPFRAIAGVMNGALNGAGDTRWPFYSRVTAKFGFMIPLMYLGATTSLGVVGIYLAFLAETTVQAGINYYRYSTGAWVEISRGYRPGGSSANSD